MTPLILKRAPIGDNEEDYDVLENGVVVGRIFFLHAVAPEGRPWMWGERPQCRQREARGARRRSDGGGRHGGIRQELATAIGPRCHCEPLAPTVKREAEEDWGR